MRYILLWTAVISSLLMSGCSSSPPVFKDPHKKIYSLVLVYIDMSDAKSEATWLRAKVITERGIEPSWYKFGFVRDKQLGTIFHNQYVSAGHEIKLDAFGGSAKSAFDNTYYKYGFHSQGRGMGSLKINKPGIYFAGSFKYIPVKTGFFKAKKFDIKRTKKPSEKEILQKFLLHVDDGLWKTMIIKRIKRLR